MARVLEPRPLVRVLELPHLDLAHAETTLSATDPLIVLAELLLAAGREHFEPRRKLDELLERVVEIALAELAVADLHDQSQVRDSATRLGKETPLRMITYPRTLRRLVR